MLEVRLAVVDAFQGRIAAQGEHLVALLAAEAVLMEDLLISHDLFAADLEQCSPEVDPLAAHNA